MEGDRSTTLAWFLHVAETQRHYLRLLLIRKAVFDGQNVNLVGMVLDCTDRRIGENSDKYPAQEHFLKLRMPCLDRNRNYSLIAEMWSRLALWAHRILLDSSYQLHTCVVCSIVSSLRECRVIPETFIINEADSNFPAFTVSNGLLPRLKECAIGAYDEPLKSTYLTLSYLHNSNSALS